MTILESCREDVVRLCMKYKVKSLYAFGSVLTEKFNPNSDIDLIVDFEPIDIMDYFDNYYDLKFSLQDVLHRQIDLLEEKAIKNLYFIEAIGGTRQLVYGLMRRSAAPCNFAE